MYKHILAATDGSKLSQKAIRSAVSLARSVGARVTGVYVISAYMPPPFGGDSPGVSASRFKQALAEGAAIALAAAAKEAEAAGVPFASVTISNAQPWEGIISTAKNKKCDLIVLGSHGRGGLSSLLLGSETSKVLAHSALPVLVCR